MRHTRGARGSVRAACVVIRSFILRSTFCPAALHAAVLRSSTAVFLRYRPHFELQRHVRSRHRRTVRLVVPPCRNRPTSPSAARTLQRQKAAFVSRSNHLSLHRPVRWRLRLSHGVAISRGSLRWHSGMQRSGASPGGRPRARPSILASILTSGIMAKWHEKTKKMKANISENIVRKKGKCIFAVT